METPLWALSLAYWIHMLATVIWIGGLASLALVVLPAARQALDEAAYARFLEKLQRKFDPLGWLSLALLGGTGMMQMSANPNYSGFLGIDSPWAVAILAKHLVIGVMVLLSAYLTWGVLPQLRRAAMRQAQGKAAPDAATLRRNELFLLRANLVISVVVLALTAFARAS